MTTLHEALALPPDTPLMVRSLRMLDWGARVRLEVVAPDGSAYAVVFNDCRDMRWRVYAHEQSDNAATPLVGIALGRGDHHGPANLLTEHFGLSVYYGTLDITPLP